MAYLIELIEEFIWKKKKKRHKASFTVSQHSWRLCLIPKNCEKNVKSVCHACRINWRIYLKKKIDIEQVCWYSPIHESFVGFLKIVI